MGPCFIVFAFLYLRSSFGEMEPRRIPICCVSVWKNPAQRWFLRRCLPPPWLHWDCPLDKIFESNPSQFRSGLDGRDFLQVNLSRDFFVFCCHAAWWHNQPSNYSRNARKWCAAMGKPRSTPPNWTALPQWTLNTRMLFWSGVCVCW